MHELSMGTLTGRKPPRQQNAGMQQQQPRGQGQGGARQGQGGKPRQQQAALFSAPKRKP